MPCQGPFPCSDITDYIYDFCPLPEAVDVIKLTKRK